MSNKARKTLALAVVLMLTSAAAAFAAGPLKGKTYVGSAPTEGIANYHHHPARLFSGGNLVFRVAHDGRSVTVSFSSSTPLMYCRTSEVLKAQTTKPARISGSGSFTAVIDQRFLATGGGEPAIVQTITGRFSGSKVSGKISTSVGECGGVARFSAKAH